MNNRDAKEFAGMVKIAGLLSNYHKNELEWEDSCCGIIIHKKVTIEDNLSKFKEEIN